MSVGAQIPVIAEMPLSSCAWNSSTLMLLVTMCALVPPTQVKKAHDWAAVQLADLFRTTFKVKTQQVARSRGQRCGDI